MSYSDFKENCATQIQAQGVDDGLLAATSAWFLLANSHGYSYHFECLGRPLIQYPQDIVQVQELMSQVTPDLVVETGIAHGGSLVLSASMLCLLDVMEGLDPRQSPRKVVGVDIDIRPHNRKALDEHPLRFKMELIEGSSIDPDTIQQVRSYADGVDRVLVSLDSNHAHEHVLAELNAYADLVSVGSYCIVFDTVVEDLPAGSFPNRPWDVGNNPKTAVHEWLKTHPEFEIDKDIDNKLLISVAPDGYLRRLS
ncbi:cephalosporin hydroxylase family protein [Synechococcus sp. HJ21-Hayes]|uniref:cephalosporin hydroxylase family protein n=1 Tax=unclassified Synechococcus TaxID=2626047 RepID=UPI0020CDC139|nr:MULTISPECIES: cephalosporin hydroxylase family protein [unclassified Synechococcus]MCP9830095.1 cephalosporin hydroxylase family protein [Synechococcus sp. JJ3a-Johnson]MCP9852097.1 cephalosporin hydroxylase family protein [Synechococcus sp. HJ21-Hayes]